MSMHIEWVHAGHATPSTVDAKWIEEQADGGNDDGDVGLFVGEDDGAVLYGSPAELVGWLRLALAAMERAIPGSTS